MVSRDTKITAAFVVLAILLWIGVTTVTENRLVQLAALLGVSVVVPMALTQWSE